MQSSSSPTTSSVDNIDQIADPMPVVQSTFDMSPIPPQIRKLALRATQFSQPVTDTVDTFCDDTTTLQTCIRNMSIAFALENNDAASIHCFQMHFTFFNTIAYTKFNVAQIEILLQEKKEPFLKTYGAQIVSCLNTHISTHFQTLIDHAGGSSTASFDDIFTYQKYVSVIPILAQWGLDLTHPKMTRTQCRHLQSIYTANRRFGKMIDDIIGYVPCPKESTVCKKAKVEPVEEVVEQKEAEPDDNEKEVVPKSSSSSEEVKAV